jgi:hypothetical protein
MVKENLRVKWAVGCENRYHVYKNWIVEAENEEEAWVQFLKIKGGATKFTNIVITKRP